MTPAKISLILQKLARRGVRRASRLSERLRVFIGGVLTSQDRILGDASLSSVFASPCLLLAILDGLVSLPRQSRVASNLRTISRLLRLLRSPRFFFTSSRQFALVRLSAMEILLDRDVTLEILAATQTLRRLTLRSKIASAKVVQILLSRPCLLYTSPSPRDATLSRMPSSA